MSAPLPPEASSVLATLEIVYSFLLGRTIGHILHTIIHKYEVPVIVTKGKASCAAALALWLPQSRDRE